MELQELRAYLDSEGKFMAYGSRIRKVKVFSAKTPPKVAGFRRAVFKPGLEAKPEIFAVVDTRTGRPAGAEAMGVHTQYDAPCYEDPSQAVDALEKRQDEIRRGVRRGFGPRPNSSRQLKVVQYGFSHFEDEEASELLKLNRSGVILFLTLHACSKNGPPIGGKTRNGIYLGWRSSLYPWNLFLDEQDPQALFAIDSLRHHLEKIKSPLTPDEQDELLEIVKMHFRALHQIYSDWSKRAGLDAPWDYEFQPYQDRYANKIIDALKQGVPKEIRRARNMGFEYIGAGSKKRPAIESLCS